MNFTSRYVLSGTIRGYLKIEFTLVNSVGQATNCGGIVAGRVASNFSLYKMHGIIFRQLKRNKFYYFK